MKKLLSLSLIGVLFSINLSANNSLTLSKLNKIPLNLDFLSTENGGNKSAIDAYSDGIGIYTISLEDEKFAAMNELVFVHGEEAKKSGESLKEYVLDKGNNKEQELAALLGTNTGGGSVIGEVCDDGDPYTENDFYIDTNGTCQGIHNPFKDTIKCPGEPIGSEIVVEGISYLVVDNNTIKQNLNKVSLLCTSNVTLLSSLFMNNTTFNEDLSKWDTSNVIYMDSMFKGASNFNKPINFDTSNVTLMTNMFRNASEFNQPINFDTSKVTKMTNMFYGASKFNQPINFDTSNLTDMAGMFQKTISFNQPINIDTSKVTRMSSMFEGSNFNQPINFDTSNVTDMRGMFQNTISFNQPLNFDTSKVTNMSNMFYRSKFNQPINFDTSNVTEMSFMFQGSIFNQNISNWNVAKVNYYNSFRDESALSNLNTPLKFR